MNHVSTIQKWRLILLVDAVLTLARLSYGFSSRRVGDAVRPTARSQACSSRRARSGAFLAPDQAPGRTSLRQTQGVFLAPDQARPRGGPENCSPREAGGGWSSGHAAGKKMRAGCPRSQENARRFFAAGRWRWLARAGEERCPAFQGALARRGASGRRECGGSGSAWVRTRIERLVAEPFRDLPRPARI